MCGKIISTGTKKFVYINFVSEEMVWKTVPVFDDSDNERVLKGVNFS